MADGAGGMRTPVGFNNDSISLAENVPKEKKSAEPDNPKSIYTTFYLISKR